MFFHLLLIVFTSLFSSLAFAADSPLNATATVHPKQIEAGQTAEIKISVSLQKEYKAYVDQFKIKILSPEGFKVSSPQIKPTKKFFDKFSNKEREGVYGNSEITAAIEAPQSISSSIKRIELELRYQACTETFCLFPEKKLLSIDLNAAPLSNSNKENSSLFDIKNLSSLLKQQSALTFLFVFIFGVLTSFTPCIFPMIPITLAILGKEAHLHSKRENILLSSLYVLGIALVYSTLGVFASMTGALFGSFLNHPAVLGTICIIFTSMALSMLGFFNFEAPLWIRDSKLAKFNPHGRLGVLTMGAVSGIVASPCVSPVLVGLLTFVAQNRNIVYGFFLLFTYALGIGAILIAIGFSTYLQKHLPKSGMWMDHVKRFLGILLLGAALYYFKLLVSENIWVIACGFSLILISVNFGLFKRKFRTRTQNILRGLIGSFFVIGLFLVFEAGYSLFRNNVESVENLATRPTEATKNTNWRPYSDELLNEAKEKQLPVIIDFAADWCAACLELENQTFTHPEFIKKSKGFMLLKFDATNSSDQLDALMKKYSIVGLPTVIIISKKGEWLQDKTLTEFEPIDKFLDRIKDIQ